MAQKDKFKERQEIVQDVIDRLIYLKDEEQQQFKTKLDELFKEYPINYEVFGMTRVYGE